jgi:hypothetical protein
MKRHFDHVDLRVPKLADVTAFYETLLPALGFSKKVAVEGWLQFEAVGDTATEFFGITESPPHVPNENRIAFWAESTADVDRLAELAAQIMGPAYWIPAFWVPALLVTHYVTFVGLTKYWKTP